MNAVMPKNAMNVDQSECCCVQKCCVHVEMKKLQSTSDNLYIQRFANIQKLSFQLAHTFERDKNNGSFT